MVQAVHASHLRVCLQVKQMTSFRQTLPAGAKTYVCKNTLLRVAAEKQGWETIIPATKVHFPSTMHAILS